MLSSKAYRLIIFAVFIGSTSLAKVFHSHTHGVFKLSLAFEGPKGLAHFDLPADAIIGFEHKPRNAAESKKVQDNLKKFEESFPLQFAFDPKLECLLQKVRIEIKYKNKNHSDLKAEYSILCKSSPRGTELSLSLLKTFPKLKQGTVDILMDHDQKSFKVSSPDAVLNLK